MKNNIVIMYKFLIAAVTSFLFWLIPFTLVLWWVIPLFATGSLWWGIGIITTPGLLILTERLFYLPYVFWEDRGWL